MARRHVCRPRSLQPTCRDCRRESTTTTRRKFHPPNCSAAIRSWKRCSTSVIAKSRSPCRCCREPHRQRMPPRPWSQLGCSDKCCRPANSRQADLRRMRRRERPCDSPAPTLSRRSRPSCPPSFKTTSTSIRRTPMIRFHPSVLRRRPLQKTHHSTAFANSPTRAVRRLNLPQRILRGPRTRRSASARGE